MDRYLVIGLVLDSVIVGCAWAIKHLADNGLWWGIPFLILCVLVGFTTGTLSGKMANEARAKKNR